MPILTIDARDYEYDMKSKVILEAFDSLDSGERMVFINDNDASDLIQKVEGERSGSLDWEPIKESPGQWEATILKIT
jgi:uncharacterized protein (DUF2249 family)